MKYRYFTAPVFVFLFICLAYPSKTETIQSQTGAAQMETSPLTKTVNDDISIVISGVWPDKCVPENPQMHVVNNKIQISTSNSGQDCGQTPTSWSHNLSIGKLAAGSYDVSVTHSRGAESKVIGAQSFLVWAPGDGLQFYLLPEPVRLIDTRPGQMACFTPGTPLGNDSNITLQARGNCTMIPVEAQAIAGNATVVNSPAVSSGFNWVTLYPSEVQVPNASNINFTEDQVIANGFTVKLGQDGAFNVYSRGATHFIVDITGYYAPPSPFGGLYYHPLPSPVRVFDTRPNAIGCDTPNSPLFAGDTRTVTAHGFCNGGTIPQHARAIVGNATVVNSITSGSNWITLFPSNTQHPPVSNLNFRENRIVPNWFTVALSQDGKFNVYSGATTNFIVDVTGYYSEYAVDVNGPGLLFKPLTTPVRLLDTRLGESACNAPGGPLPNDNSISIQATGVCFSEVIPSAARAIQGNATVVNFISSGSNWITLFPCDNQSPFTSNLNYTDNQIVANQFTSRLSNAGNVCIYSRASTHFLMDLSGYFAQ